MGLCTKLGTKVGNTQQNNQSGYLNVVCSSVAFGGARERPLCVSLPYTLFIMVEQLNLRILFHLGLCKDKFRKADFLVFFTSRCLWNGLKKRGHRSIFWKKKMVRESLKIIMLLRRSKIVAQIISCILLKIFFVFLGWLNKRTLSANYIKVFLPWVKLCRRKKHGSTWNNREIGRFGP